VAKERLGLSVDTLPIEQVMDLSSLHIHKLSQTSMLQQSQRPSHKHINTNSLQNSDTQEGQEPKYQSSGH
jgi:hypothetical protein